jgi:hypothetical protein
VGDQSDDPNPGSHEGEPAYVAFPRFAVWP